MKSVVEDRLRSLWPDVHAQDLLGLGYAPPFLETFRHETRRSIAAMPANQGVHQWMNDFARGSSSVLTDDDRLPFPDAMFDKVLVVHGLEEAENVPRFMREVWRVCAPEAHIVVIVASRRGIWSRAESTPFGYGRPYTRRQLTKLLNDSLFQTTAWTHALYMPPIPWKILASAGDAWERAGEMFWPHLGGLLMVEGVKRQFIDPTAGAPVRKIAPVTRPALNGTRRLERKK